MICKTKGKHLRRIQVWFEDYDESIHENIDVVYFHGVKEIVSGKWVECKKQFSLINRLDFETDILKKGLSKTYRNEINRAEKENISVEFYESSEICNNQKLLDEFSDVYKEMYKQKGMKENLPISEIISYAREGHMIISVAKYSDIPVVFHSYIFDDKNSRLMHSCSEFRNTDSSMRNLIGRANKYLHWNDFLYLKNKGIVAYDWGGCSSFTNANGIDKFKLYWGGEQVEYYNIAHYITMKAKILYFLKNVR